MPLVIYIPIFIHYCIHTWLYTCILRGMYKNYLVASSSSTSKKLKPHYTTTAESKILELDNSSQNGFIHRVCYCELAVVVLGILCCRESHFGQTVTGSTKIVTPSSDAGTWVHSWETVPNRSCCGGKVIIIISCYRWGSSASNIRNERWVFLVFNIERVSTRPLIKGSSVCYLARTIHAGNQIKDLHCRKYCELLTPFFAAQLCPT